MNATVNSHRAQNIKKLAYSLVGSEFANGVRVLVRCPYATELSSNRVIQLEEATYLLCVERQATDDFMASAGEGHSEGGLLRRANVHGKV